MNRWKNNCHIESSMKCVEKNNFYLKVLLKNKLKNSQLFLSLRLVKDG